MTEVGLSDVLLGLSEVRLAKIPSHQLKHQRIACRVIRGIIPRFRGVLKDHDPAFWRFGLVVACSCDRVPGMLSDSAFWLFFVFSPVSVLHFLLQGGFHAAQQLFLVSMVFLPLPVNGYCSPVA